MSQYSWENQIRGATRRLDRSATLTSSKMAEAFRRFEGPRKVGKGPPHFVASTGIERQPFKWDTNSFYRRLGLTPDADRVEIARAFSELDPSAPDFLYYATAAKVLLKKYQRMIYDAISLGLFYADDPAIVQRMLQMVFENGGVPPEDVEWAVYADSGVSDDDAQRIDPLWRSMLSAEIARKTKHWPSPPAIGLGVAYRANVRWEQVGYLPVLFVAIDSRPSERYVVEAVETLLRYARPTMVDEDAL